MVRLRRGYRKDMGKVGIHLYNPSKFDIDSAKDDAERHGFKTIWVHGRSKYYSSGVIFGAKKAARYNKKLKKVM